MFYNDLQSKGLSGRGFARRVCGPVLCGVQPPGDACAGDSGNLAHVGPLWTRSAGSRTLCARGQNAGAKRVILPLSAIAGLQSVSSEIISGLSPVFHGW